jgi:hypothetical protein
MILYLQIKCSGLPQFAIAPSYSNSALELYELHKGVIITFVIFLNIQASGQISYSNTGRVASSIQY